METRHGGVRLGHPRRQAVNFGGHIEMLRRNPAEAIWHPEYGDARFLTQETDCELEQQW